MVIDFSDSPRVIANFDGNDEKIHVVHQGAYYLLKFGEPLDYVPNNPNLTSYLNSTVSEYVGSHVYNALGIASHETILGTYRGRQVVACRNFMKDSYPDNRLVSFQSIEHSYIGSSERKRAPKYEHICRLFETSWEFAPIRKEAVDRYWDMFVVDALIAHGDRHGGNWGYIADADETRLLCVAPVYDNASSFYPRLSEAAMDSISFDKQEMTQRSLTFPKATLSFDDQKVHYHRFLLTKEGFAARERLYRLSDRLDELDIASLCEGAEVISDAQIRYFEQMLLNREAIILAPAYELYCKELGIKPSHEWYSNAEEYLRDENRHTDDPGWE